MFSLYLAATAVVSPSPVKSASAPQLAQTFRRAEFWDRGNADVIALANVLGRWEKPEEWEERTEFAVLENDRVQSEEQAATKKRFEMAQRLGQVERVALQQNAAKLPFRNEAMAKACGLTCEDFNNMPVSPDAINILFDVLAESKSGLLPRDVVAARRDALIADDGGVNLGTLRLSLYKARILVILSWFVFGKGNLVGILVLLKVISDATGINTFGEIFDWLLAHGDVALLVLGSGSLMTWVGRSMEM